jgi:hypothetical protein
VSGLGYARTNAGEFELARGEAGSPASRLIHLRVTGAYFLKNQNSGVSAYWL